ncbi:unnamed protein product [Effrenium voratum]|nr:unnamed protein product [Effrenium voratum]
MADPKPLLETSVLLERQISGGAGHAGSPPGGRPSTREAEASVLQAQVALKMLVEQPDLRKAIFGKALKLCQDMDDQPLTEALHACQKMAEEQYAGRKSPPL